MLSGQPRRANTTVGDGSYGRLSGTTNIGVRTGQAGQETPCWFEETPPRMRGSGHIAADHRLPSASSKKEAKKDRRPSHY